MKLEVIGKELPEGYEIEVSMNGEIAVIMGMSDFMKKREKT